MLLVPILQSWVLAAGAAVDVGAGEDVTAGVVAAGVGLAAGVGAGVEAGLGAAAGCEQPKRTTLFRTRTTNKIKGSLFTFLPPVLPSHLGPDTGLYHESEYLSILVPSAMSFY